MATSPASESTVNDVTQDVTAVGEKEQPTVDVTAAAADSEVTTKGPTEDKALKASRLTKENAELANGTEALIPTQSTGNAQEPAQPTVSPLEKPIEVPAPAATQVPIAHMVPATPAKRPSDLKIPSSPEPKRAKVSPIPAPVPASPTTSTACPGPKKLSLAVKKRKEIENLKKGREDIARKRAIRDAKYSAEKQQMKEEMERLDREFEEEKRALAEEKAQYEEEEAMLQEFLSERNGD